MLRRLVGRMKRLAGRGERSETSNPSAATPVTDSVPDDWNDVTAGRVASGAGRPPSTSGLQSTEAPELCSIVFRDLDTRIEVASGTTILDAAIEAGVDLNHYCGGMCSCGSCRIIDVEGEVSELDDIEEITLDLVREGEGDRLGCQTRILGPVTVTLPPQDF